jgi:transposase-like protein
MSILSAKYMHDEAAAFEHVEAMLWADGPVCPFCGVVDNAHVLQGVRSKASRKNPEGIERHGLKKCQDCGKQFTVRKGTTHSKDEYRNGDDDQARAAETLMSVVGKPLTYRLANPIVA